MVKEILKENLNGILKDRGLNMEALSELIGMSSGGLYRSIRTEALKLRFIQAICDNLQIHPIQLFVYVEKDSQSVLQNIARESEEVYKIEKIMPKSDQLKNELIKIKNEVIAAQQQQINTQQQQIKFLQDELSSRRNNPKNVRKNS